MMMDTQKQSMMIQLSMSMADLVIFSGKFPFFLTFYGKSFINYYKRHSEDFSILMLKMFINRHFKELSSTY